MTKKLESITIYGTLIGTIWQGVECTKEVVKTFTPDGTRFTCKWNGLQDALSIITKDGDFQYCSLRDAVINVQWSDERYILTKALDIPVGKLTAPFFEEQ